MQITITAEAMNSRGWGNEARTFSVNANSENHDGSFRVRHNGDFADFERREISAIIEDIQLYDVCVAPKSEPTNVTFMMRAPLHVIALLFDFHADATKRVKRETDTECGLSLVYHSRGRFTEVVHAIQKASKPLGTSR